MGTKRVEGSEGVSAGDPDGHGIYNEKFPRGDGREVGYADADGKEEVEDWDCPPSCPVRQLDEQSGDLGSGYTGSRRDVGAAFEFGEHGDWGSYGDTGGASRFYYCAKASRSEREAGLEGVEMVRLRDDLTEEEREHVAEELRKAGVDV